MLQFSGEKYHWTQTGLPVQLCKENLWVNWISWSFYVYTQYLQELDAAPVCLRFDLLLSALLWLNLALLLQLSQRWSSPSTDLHLMDKTYLWLCLFIYVTLLFLMVERRKRDKTGWWNRPPARKGTSPFHWVLVWNGLCFQVTSYIYLQETVRHMLRHFSFYCGYKNMWNQCWQWFCGPGGRGKVGVESEGVGLEVWAGNRS